MNTTANQTDTSQKRVAILGGGPASIAAAYWLTAPEQNNQYDVTVYTQGWRLGGKCASGRNAAEANGIEEHGLHMLMGCYQNGFATMRSCYGEWRKAYPDPDNMLQTWEDAFLPQRQVSLMSRDGPGSPPSWAVWNLPFPRFPGEPGDGPLVPGSPAEPLPPAEQLLLAMSRTLIDNIPKDAPFHDLTVKALRDLEGLFLTSAVPPAVVTDALKQAANAIKPNLAVSGGEPSGDIAPEASVSQWLQRIAILADLGVAMALGFVLDLYRRGPSGYDQVDKHDLREWLGKHGATDTSVNSAPINAFYDLTFATIGGNPSNGASIAAGVSFRTMLEMTFGYRNAPLFKMAAGMGDVVFTPLYQVLLSRGVKFEFFRRVINLKTSDNQLSEIVLMNQAETVSGEPYQPLNRIDCAHGKQLEVWPNQPDWSKLKNGPQLQEEGVDFEYSGCMVSAGPPITLSVGTDFDIAVCGIPPEALIPFADDLVTIEAWETALDASASVATQSLQLWMKPDLKGLGWDDGSTVMTAYQEPYDSWGDMSQVIAAESWSPSDAPGSVGYFCGTMEIPKGGISLIQMHAVATANADSWMTSSLQTIWPDIGADPTGSSMILDRYSRANFDLSEQYVQTPAGGNVASRLHPAKPAGLTNLYVVGDWTRTRFSGGCFESAIESGMLASRGISGFPKTIKTA